MEVSCTSCPARFAVPDDKVRGRKVRITCKRCGSPIVVDGTHLEGGARQSKPDAEAVKSVRAPAARAAPAPAPAAKAPAPSVAKPAPAPQAKPAVAAPAPAAIKPQPAPAAPKPTAAKPAAAAAPRPGAQPRVSPAAAKSEWAALEAEGKSGAWREPAAATPGAGPAIRRTMIGGMEPPPGAPRPTPASVPRPNVPAPAPAPAATPKASPKQTMLGLAPPSSAQPIPPIAPVAPAPRPAPRPEPPSPRVSLSDAAEIEPEWTVALTDEQHEEMRTPEVVELYVRGSIDHETFIWADGMEDWKRPWEIPMIATALAARGMKQPTGDEPPRSASFSDEEPDEEEATIVASVDMLPMSSRGKMPSGVWREPGRATPEPEEEVGFEDVTVSLDGAKAAEMLRGLGGATPAHESQPPPSEDVPTRIESDVEAPPESGFGGGVDDLLAGMEDPTTNFADGGFQAVARPLHSVADFTDDDDTTIEQSKAPALANPNAELYQPNLADLALPSPLDYPAQPGAAPQNLFAGLDVPNLGRSQPLDSLLAEPPSAMEVLAPPPVAAAPKKKSRLFGCVMVLFLLGVILAGAGAASFFLKQPASLYGPDGRPKLPGVLRQYL